MLAFIIRRLGYAFIMVILVSFVGFVIIELPPGDFLTQKIAELQARGDRSAENRIEEYRARYGLDEPLMQTLCQLGIEIYFWRLWRVV